MYAEEDKKRKESVEIRNQAESMVYQTEKTIDEIGDKADSAALNNVKAAKEALAESLKGDNVDDIKAKTEALEKEFQQLSQILYQNAQATGGAQGAQGAAGGFDPTGGAANAGASDSSDGGRDNVVDADYEVVDED